jgi:hypothetical protein
VTSPREPLPSLPLHQRLIEAAWQDGLMHLDGPEVLVARVLRELAGSMSGDRADEIRMLAMKVEGAL